MAMTNRNNAKFDSIIMFTLDELVPQDHLVRKLESALDFRFIYSKVNHLYSPHGRPSIDPVVLFKMLIINIVFGINSICGKHTGSRRKRSGTRRSGRKSIQNEKRRSSEYLRTARKTTDCDIQD